MTPPPLAHTTRLLQKARQGDPVAASELLPLVYDQLRGLAGRYMREQRPGHTLQPTALVHEAYLKLIESANVEWRDQAHFIGIAARAMQQVLIQHARRAAAQKRGGGALRVTLAGIGETEASQEIDFLALGAALEELQKLDERKARVVELRFFGGLSNEEVAQALGTSLRTVEGDWYLARAWLRGKLNP